MIRSLVFLAIALAASGARAQSGWSPLGNAGQTILVGVSAPDPSNVFVTGVEFGGGQFPTLKSRVYASGDGGRYFTDISGAVGASGGFEQATSVFFVDAQTGWVAVGRKVWRTADRGVTWASVDVGFDVGALHFFDARRGLAAGAGGQVKGTTDGGSTWTAVSTPGGPMLRRLHFVDGQNGWAAGHDEDDAAIPSNAALLLTTDGGRTWTQGAQLSGSQGISTMEFLCDGKTGWVGAYSHPSEDEWQAVLYRTTDGGKTLVDAALPLEVGRLKSFMTTPIRTGLPLAMHWEDALRGRLVGAAFLMNSGSSGGGGSSSSGIWRVVNYETGDGGATWTKTNLGEVTVSFPNTPPNDGTFVAGLMRDLEGGWIVGQGGRVWSSQTACTSDDDCRDGHACLDATICVDASPDCAAECDAGEELVDGECVPAGPDDAPDGGTNKGPGDDEKPGPGAGDGDTDAAAGCGCATGASAWTAIALLGLVRRRRR